jgi:hypothetical protein
MSASLQGQRQAGWKPVGNKLNNMNIEVHQHPTREYSPPKAMPPVGLAPWYRILSQDEIWDSKDKENSVEKLSSSRKRSPRSYRRPKKSKSPRRKESSPEDEYSKRAETVDKHNPLRELEDPFAGTGRPAAGTGKLRERKQEDFEVNLTDEPAEGEVKRVTQSKTRQR